MGFIDLPVTKHREEILKLYDEHQVLLVVGETGSGKTTQIPKFIHEHAIDTKGMIAVTQPRRVAAMSLAKRVAEETGTRLGDLVGYSVRFDELVSRETRIKFVTDGMLLRELLIDPALSRYSTIVLDEAHERTLRTDILFGVLRRLQRMGTRPQLKIVIMSATMNVQRFLDFFEDVAYYRVPGRQHPVRLFYTVEPQQDYLDATVLAIFQLHLERGKGAKESGPTGDDMLVFLTGQEEIEAVQRLLEEHAASVSANSPDVPILKVCPIYASLPATQQMAVFAPTPRGTRKIVLATNIAETSITIPGIRYVIDPGMVKMRLFNTRTGMETLAIRPISKAAARQRAGRAGREQAGECYRLFPESAFRGLEDETSPEILRTNLANVLLVMRAAGIEDVIGFDYLETPSQDSLKRALEELLHLGGLEDGVKGFPELTPRGRLMAECPLPPPLSRVLLEAARLECVEPVLMVLAMLSAENVFVSVGERESAAAAKRAFAHKSGDHLMLLSLYRAYLTVKGDIRWCQQNFIDARAMRTAIDVRAQLAQFCERHGLLDKRQDVLSNIPSDSSTDPSLILQAFAAGYFMQCAYKQPDGGYRTLLGRQAVHIHPSSILHGQRPDCIIYHELTMTTKCYLRTDVFWEMEKLVRLWHDTLEPLQGHHRFATMGIEEDSQITVENIIQSLNGVPHLTNQQRSVIKGLTELYLLESLLSMLTSEEVLAQIQLVHQTLHPPTTVTVSTTATTPFPSTKTEYGGDRLRYLFPDEDNAHTKPKVDLISVLDGTVSFEDLFTPWNMKHDTWIQNQFPLLKSLSQGVADARLIPPLYHLLSIRRMRNRNDESSQRPPVPMPTTSVRSHSLNYLDVTKTTYLQNTPPPPQLRIHSETAQSGIHLWARKTLGKLVGYALLLTIGNAGVAFPGSTASRSIIRHHEISYLVKVRRPTEPQLAPDRLPPAPINDTVTQMMTGMLTALHDWHEASPAECWELIRGQLRSTEEIGSLAGLMLGMGFMTKFLCGTQIGAVDMLGLLSHGDPLFEAAAAVALAAANSPCSDLRRLLQVNLAGAGRHTQQLPTIDHSMQSASALALGLVERHAPRDGRSGTTGLLLQQLVHADDASLVLYCGIALALIGGAVGFTRNELDQCIELVRTPPKGRPHTLRTAACLALARQPLDPLQLATLDEAACLDEWSFDDWLLHRVIQRAFHQSHQNTAVPSMPAQHLQILMTETACLRYVGDCLALGLLSLTREMEVASVGPRAPLLPTDLLTVVTKLGELSRRKALDYQGRRARLVFGHCYDLLLLAWAMMRRGTSDEQLVKILSEDFDQPLDYCYGRALIQSLALSLLSCQKPMLGGTDSTNVGGVHEDEEENRLIMILYLVAVLPLPSLEAPKDPITILRHCLPLLASRREDRDEYGDVTGRAGCSYSTADAHDTLKRWVGSRGGMTKALPRRLLHWFVDDASSSAVGMNRVDETIRLLRTLL